MASDGKYPSQYETRLTLRNGREVLIRPIKQTDEDLIMDMFGKLSANSIYMRFLRHMHSLPKEMLYRFTHVNYQSEFALAAIIREDGRDAIVAIARYTGSADDTTELAAAVRDDWQNLGLGKALLKRLVEIGKEHGIYRYSGVSDPQNIVIRQILKELGFNTKYSLRDGFLQVEIVV